MPAEEGESSRQAASSAASAASTATRVSASRCRTAWNWLIGRPNWVRSSGVDPGQFEHGPGGADQLVGDGQPGPRHRRRPLPRG